MKSMPRLRFSPFSSKREGTPSPGHDSFVQQAERERKRNGERDLDQEEELSSRSSFVESDVEDRDRGISEYFDAELIHPDSYLADTRGMSINNSGSSGDPPGAKQARRTPTPKLDKKNNDSGYGEMDRSPGTSSRKDSMTKKEANMPYQGESRKHGPVPGTLTKVTSSASRLDRLTGPKARLLVLNENLTLRSLKKEENVDDIMALCDIVQEGATVEEVLKNFGRLPVDKMHHFALVGEYLRNLHVESRMVDVLINVGGQTFAAHRVALACHSKYFADMFMAHTEKTQLPVEITLNGMGALAFQAFLRYVYTGEMIISPESVADIMAIGEKLNIPQITAICREYIDTITPENAVSLLTNKCIIRGSPIFKHAYRLVLDNFPDVYDNENFLMLSLELLCVLLSDDELYVKTEMDVFWAGLKWVAFHITERQNNITKVMKCVRFPHLTKRELFQCFEVTDLLRKSPACREMIFCAIWIITAQEQGRVDPLNLPKPNHRRCSGGSGIPQKFADDIKDLFQDATLGTKTPVDDSYLEEDRLKRVDSPASCLSANNSSEMYRSVSNTVECQSGDILAIGGFSKMEKDKGALKEVERYSTSENQWKYYTGLPEPRQHHAVAMLGSTLYLVGGNDPRKAKKSQVATNTVFKFDSKTGNWSKGTSMIVHRMNHGLCEVFGALYAIGGQDEKNRILRSVEYYDPTVDGWKRCKDLNTSRCNFGTTVCKGHIYVAGGFTGAPDKRGNLPITDKFECFDPRLHTWTDLCPMTMPRCQCNLVTAGDDIYICGGATKQTSKDELRSVASIDMYSLETNTWQHKTDLIRPRHNSGATVIGNKIYLIGGMSSINDQTLQSIECYDTQTECWDTSVQDLPYPAKCLGCVSIPVSN